MLAKKSLFIWSYDKINDDTKSTNNGIVGLNFPFVKPESMAGCEELIISLLITLMVGNLSLM